MSGDCETEDRVEGNLGRPQGALSRGNSGVCASGREISSPASSVPIVADASEVDTFNCPLLADERGAAASSATEPSSTGAYGFSGGAPGRLG